MQLPSHLHLFTTHEDHPLSLISEKEQQFCAAYHPKRQQHFINGRVCAHRALEALGEDVGFVGVNEDKTPSWPENIVGSITHTEGCASAVVAFAHEQPALGVDVEQIHRCHKGLWSRVLTENERAWVEAKDAEQQVAYATAHFSLKESFYKYYFTHPLGRRGLDFLEVEVCFSQGVVTVEGGGMVANAFVQMDEKWVLSIVW